MLRRLAFIVLIAGCDRAALGGVGESCTKKADCADGLSCFDQKCVTAADATPAPTAKATTSDAPVLPSIAATNRSEAPNAPAPPEERPAARPVPIPRPTSDPSKPDTLTILEGFTTAEGPFGGLDEYCRLHRTADPESSDFAACNIAKRDAEASVVVPQLGTLTAIETGEGVFEQHYGLQFESDDTLRTTHVLPKLATTGGGNEESSLITEIRIVPAGRGQAKVDFVVEHSKRIDDGSGRPGVRMGIRKTSETFAYLCGRSSTGVPGCRERGVIEPG